MLLELGKLVHPNRKLLLVVRSRLPELQEPQVLTILRPPAGRPSLELREQELEDSYHPSLELREQEPEDSYHPSPALPVLPELAVPGERRVEEHHLSYCALE